MLLRAKLGESYSKRAAACGNQVRDRRRASPRPPVFRRIGEAMVTAVGDELALNAMYTNGYVI